jgi:hypothetical protein
MFSVIAKASTSAPKLEIIVPGSHERAIGKTTAFVEDLGGQLASWSEDENERLGLAAPSSLTGSRLLLAHSKQICQYRHKKGSSFTGSYPHNQRMLEDAGKKVYGYMNVSTHVPVWAQAIRS